MRARSLTAAALAIFAVAACGSSEGAAPVTAASTTVSAASGTTTGSPTSTGSSAAGTTAPSGGKLTAPLRVTLEPSSRTASVEIGPDGGVIEVTNAGGTRFSLAVPPGALWASATITAIPTAALGEGGGAHGVVFGPAGLWFVQPARLTIVPSAAVPVPRQVLFEFGDDGAELVAAEPALDTPGMVVLVSHFSGFGFADLADRARETYVGWKTDRAEERVQNDIRDALAAERERILTGGGDPSKVAKAVGDGLKTYEAEVVIPRLENAGTSCAAAKQAIATALGQLRQMQLLGTGAETIGGPSSNSRTARTWKSADLLTLADGPCEKEAIAACRAAKDPAILVRHWLGRERTRQLLGTEGGPDPDAVHRAEAICDPQAYQVVGGLQDWQVSQTVCDITKPFTLSSDVGTMKLSGGLSGTYEFGGVFAAQYTGTYSISFPDGPKRPGTMTGQGSGSISGAAGSGAESYTLTPVGPAC